MPRIFRDGRGYIPLNSLTLGKHDKSETKKQAWWQVLPKEKVNQNKVIRAKLETIEKTVPEWPWMKGQKAEISTTVAKERIAGKNQHIGVLCRSIQLTQTLWSYQEEVRPNVKYAVGSQKCKGRNGHQL